MKELRFHVDIETGQPHIYDHGVSEDEVQEVMAHPQDDRPGDKASRVAIGQTSAGRYLRVIYSPDEDGIGVFIVTAYDLIGKPLRAHRRRLRRRYR